VRRLIARNERGFTLIELLITLGIGSLLAAGITMAIFQVVTIPSSSSAHMTAVKQVESAIHWIRNDTWKAQKIECNEDSDSGFPLTLTWVEWEGDAAVHKVTYSIEDGNLVRTHSVDDGEQKAIVAQHIEDYGEMTRVRETSSGLELMITATVPGFRIASETRVVEIKPRTSA